MSLSTLVIPKDRFTSSKYLIFEWLQCLDTCLFQKHVRNSIVEDLHTHDGEMSVAAFVFDVKGEPAGFAYGYIDDEGGSLFIRYISCKLQRHGYGSALVKALEQYAHRQGLGKIELSSTSGAKGFYERRGYLFGEMNSLYRRSLRLARNDTPGLLIPFVKFLESGGIELSEGFDSSSVVSLPA